MRSTELDEQVADEPLCDAILSVKHQEIAPDGSLVRVLVRTDRGSLAHFEFRITGRGPLAIVGVTMPPWPGGDEAMESEGVWNPYISTEAP